MSNDPLAIIFVSNGPGELATWVKPLARELHNQISLRPAVIRGYDLIKDGSRPPPIN